MLQRYYQSVWSNGFWEHEELWRIFILLWKRLGRYVGGRSCFCCRFRTCLHNSLRLLEIFAAIAEVDDGGFWRREAPYIDLPAFLTDMGNCHRARCSLYIHKSHVDLSSPTNSIIDFCSRASSAKCEPVQESRNRRASEPISI